MLRTDLKKIKSVIGERSWAVPLFLFVLTVAILGAMPHKHIFWARCWMAEWAVLLFIGLVFIKDWWLKLFFIYIVYSIVKLLYHPNRFGGFFTFYHIFLFLILYQTLMDKIKKKHIFFIMNGLCILIMAQLVYMYFQLFGIDPLFKPSGQYISGKLSFWVQGFWMHTNFSGASLAITIPLFFRRKWWICLIPIVPMLVATRSLGAILSLGIGLIFFSCFMFKKWKLSTIILAIVCSIFIYGNTLDKAQMGIFKGKSDRAGLNKRAVEFIKLSPIKGWGIGQFKYVINIIGKNVYKLDDNRVHAHNETLEIAMETGLPVLIPIFGFLGTLFCQFFRKRNHITLILITAILITLVNSCSTFLFHTPMAYIWLAFIIMFKKEVTDVATLHRP